MSNLARGIYSVRAAFLRIMFPNRNLEEEGNNPGNPGVEPPGYSAPTLGNAVIGLMTSLEMAVKHWSNELMYIIVDEDGASSLPFPSPIFSLLTLISCYSMQFIV